MNNFFSYQPEFLYSINTILSPILFGKSAVMIIGLFGVLIGIVSLFFLKYKKINNEKCCIMQAPKIRHICIALAILLHYLKQKSNFVPPV